MRKLVILLFMVFIFIKFFNFCLLLLNFWIESIVLFNVIGFIVILIWLLLIKWVLVSGWFLLICWLVCCIKCLVIFVNCVLLIKWWEVKVIILKCLINIFFGLLIIILLIELFFISFFNGLNLVILFVIMVIIFFWFWVVSL